MRKSTAKAIIVFGLIVIALIIMPFFEYTLQSHDDTGETAERLPDSYAEVVGSSMSPTLEDGDIVGIYYDETPEYHDLITFRYKDEKYIKRVIGLPGDTIFIHDGDVFRNGVKEVRFSETETRPYSMDDEVVVPEQCYFVLGDNRKSSWDSRVIGPVDIRDVEGVAEKSEEYSTDAKNDLTCCSGENGEKNYYKKEKIKTDAEYDLKDLVGVYSNGQSNIIIRKRMDTDFDDMEVGVTVKWASVETPMVWNMNGSYDPGTATINYNEGNYYEGPASDGSNKLDIKYSDGSGRFIFEDNTSFIWEDDKDGAGDGEIFNSCVSYADQEFAGIWRRSTGEYYELNEDGSYSFVSGEQNTEGRWAVIEAPFGDETRYYIILDDNKDLFEYSKYSENVDCILLNNTNIFFRGDE